MTEFEALRVLALSGGEWVIWLLLASSVLTVAVIVERALVQSRERKALAALLERAEPALEKGDLEAVSRAAAETGGAAAAVLSAGLRRCAPESAEERMAAARLRAKLALERRLLILGSLGNNAPFIGLFGTVLGVIKAFHDLSMTASAGPEVVMQGLSEALIATAVGLLVAIPAVMAYNLFQKRAADILNETDALCRLVAAELKSKK
jgi:biopolymer transport protein ExbB